MVIPVLRTHLNGDKQGEQRSHRAGDDRREFAILPQGFRQSRHTKTDPDTERIERTGIRIVTLTRLVRSLVQVKHNRNTGHEEEEEGHPETLNTLLAGIRLIEQA